MTGRHLTLFHLERLTEPLALSRDQYRALKDLALESGRQLVRALDEIQAHEFRMKRAHNWSKERLKPLERALRAARADFRWLKLETGSRAYGLLSPEQQRSFRRWSEGFRQPA